MVKETTTPAQVFKILALAKVANTRLMANLALDGGWPMTPGQKKLTQDLLAECDKREQIIKATP